MLRMRYEFIFWRFASLVFHNGRWLRSAHQYRTRQEQNQGDAPKGNNVVTEYVMDYSDQFTTYSIFNGRDALLRWAREQGKLNNIVIVIKRSDYEGEGKRRPRVILACERNGNYKSCKSSETTDTRSDANSDMKKCARDTSTKKCGCPFLLKCVNIGDGDDWKLEVVCGVHNHPISEYLQGHSFVGRLIEEENALLVDMSKSLVKPRDILVTIKYRDAMNGSTMKTIYNARIRNKTKEFAGRTQMQHFLTKLSEHSYIEWHRTSDDIVTDLFWTHPINIDILRAFPHVLIMDCTYKTNRYRFPLLQIVGVTSTNMTFSIAYVYMNAEKEGNYTWALTALRSSLDDNCLPGVIVIDRELALMNSNPSSARPIFP
ncbi:unnamed protein product [Prunus armeniaca]